MTGFVDRPTAFFHEIHTQIDHYDTERFRRFYHEHMGKVLLPQNAAEQLGVDFFSASYLYTVPGCQLAVGFFGDPDDHLISSAGRLSTTAKRTLERVRTFRSRLASVSNTSAIKGLRRAVPIRGVSITLFAGRRALGPEVHEKFRALAAKYLAIKTTRSHQFQARSFDAIVDEAMGLALTPFPFPNQALLKRF